MLLIVATSLAGIYSCDDDNYSKEDFESGIPTVTYVTPGEFKNYFFATNLEKFEIDELDFSIAVIPGSEGEVIEKLEIYAYFLEEVNGTQISHGGTGGKLVTTIEEIENPANIPVKVTIDELYDLFASDLQNTIRPHKLIASDLIEFKWVVTNGDDNTTDTRFDCAGDDCQYIFGVDEGVACANNLAGKVYFQWIDAGSGYARYIGMPGEINIERLSLDGRYHVDDFEFGSSGMGPKEGTMIDNDCSGLLTITNSEDTVWEFSNFNGASVDVTFTNKWTIAYPQFEIWGQVRLTRADGQDWPTDLKGPNQ